MNLHHSYSANVNTIVKWFYFVWHFELWNSQHVCDSIKSGNILYQSVRFWKISCHLGGIWWKFKLPLVFDIHNSLTVLFVFILNRRNIYVNNTTAMSRLLLKRSVIGASMKLNKVPFLRLSIKWKKNSKKKTNFNGFNNLTSPFRINSSLESMRFKTIITEMYANKYERMRIAVPVIEQMRHMRTKQTVWGIADVYHPISLESLSKILDRPIGEYY